MQKSLFILFLLILLSKLIVAQEITGIVIDSETKKPLPFVNVVLDQNNLGTTTNIDGQFAIENKGQAQNLFVSYLGYHKDTIHIHQETGHEMIIPLHPKTYDLEEVIILPGENPANKMIKRVIANKDINNPESLESFSFTSYNKMIFTVERDHQSQPDTLGKSKLDETFSKHHLLLIETVNEKQFIKPDKYKEQIVASKVSGFSDPVFSLIASQVQALSFYNDFFEILDKRYLNPISKNSDKKYLFLLQDTLFNERGDSIFVISYRPKKGKNFDGLKGFLHINTNKYAIQSVVAQPLEKDQGMTIEIKQNYELVNNEQWFPKELITKIIFEDALTSSGVDGYNMVAKGRSYIKDINLSPGLNKKDFDNIEVKVAENAHQQSNDFWNIQRVQPLEEIEAETYRIIDSISKAENLEKKLAGIEVFMNGSIPVKWFNLPLNKIMDYNNYEGYRLGLGIMTNEKVSPYFSVGGYFGYGFADKEWKYGGDLILNLHKKSESKLHFSYAYDVKEKGGYQFFEQADFSSSEIYRKYMIENMDLEEKYEVSFHFLSLHYLKSRIFLNQSYITQTGEYTFGPVNTTATGEFGFSEIGIQLRYAYNEKYMQTLRAKYSLGTNYPVLYANLIKGTNWLDGEFEYTKYEAKITKSIKTRSLGKTKLTFIGGLIEGNIPLTKLYNGNGSYQPFSLEAENSFGTMRMNEFYADRFLSVYFKHDFGNLLFRTEKFAPKFAVINNFGIGAFTQKTNQHSVPVKSFEKGYYECGILINNILSQSFLGYGFGVFYRYGPYAFEKTTDNFSYKLSLTLGL